MTETKSKLKRPRYPMPELEELRHDGLYMNMAYRPMRVAW